MIYANKQDLISALPAEEIEELLCLGMINDRAWTIVACSAKEKEGMFCRIEEVVRFAFLIIVFHSLLDELLSLTITFL